MKSTTLKLTKEQRENLLTVADTVGMLSNGHYIARRGFFYKHGRSAEAMANSVRLAVTNAVIVDQGEVWKDFRGGAPTSRQSHFWVEFYLKEPEYEVSTPAELNAVSPALAREVEDQADSEVSASERDLGY